MNNPGEITKFDQSQVATLQESLNVLFNGSAGIRYTNVLPTANTVGERDIVVYDDGLGVKRIYVITGKKNLGYIELT